MHFVEIKFFNSFNGILNLDEIHFIVGYCFVLMCGVCLGYCLWRE